MLASYVIASEAHPESDEVDYWPRVTVYNHTSRAIVAAFDGNGEASNPEFPDSPMQMRWGVDDSPLSVAAGKTVTVDLGKQFGEVLAAFSGGQITTWKITASAAHDDGFVYGDSASCSLTVTHSG